MYSILRQNSFALGGLISAAQSAETEAFAMATAYPSNALIYCSKGFKKRLQCTRPECSNCVVVSYVYIL